MNRSPIVAEWILKLFTTNEQASSITGDLEETHRNRIEFWWTVSRTASRFLWSDLVGGRRTLRGLAIRGTLAQSVYMVVTNFALFPAARRIDEPEWLIQLAMLATGFQAGRWVARRAHDKEIAAAFALNALNFIIGFLFVATSILFHKFGVSWLDFISVKLLMWPAPVAGAAFERLFRRALPVKV